MWLVAVVLLFVPVHVSGYPVDSTATGQAPNASNTRACGSVLVPGGDDPAGSTETFDHAPRDQTNQNSALFDAAACAARRTTQVGYALAAGLLGLALIAWLAWDYWTRYVRPPAFSTRDLKRYAGGPDPAP